MSIKTPWTTVDCTIHSLTGGLGAVGNGSCRFRHRRDDGEVQWAFELVVGSSTYLGSGRLFFDVDATASAAFEVLSGAIIPPASAVVLDASGAGVGTPGSLMLTSGYEWQIQKLVEPEVYEQVVVFAVIGWFGAARLSAANPIDLADGDRIVAGNALEAFDN